MSLQKQLLKSKNTYRVTFSFPKEVAPKASEIKVLGDFNEWDPGKALRMKLKNGEFLATVELPVGEEFQFRYLIDNEVWENDGAADKYSPSPFGVENSVVVTAFMTEDDMAH